MILCWQRSVQMQQVMTAVSSPGQLLQVGQREKQKIAVANRQLPNPQEGGQSETRE